VNVMAEQTARTVLHRTIHTQAEAVERMAQADLAAPAEKLAGARRVLLIGTGTSGHAAELGAMMLADAGVDARWSSAAQFARWGSPFRSGDAVIVITHTAGTAFALRCREQALSAGVPLVSVTGIGSGWPEAVETVEREQSETYTVSYTTALAVLAGIAHRLGAGQYGPGQLARAASAVRAVCEETSTDGIEPPARALGVIRDHQAGSAGGRRTEGRAGAWIAERHPLSGGRGDPGRGAPAAPGPGQAHQPISAAGMHGHRRSLLTTEHTCHFNERVPSLAYTLDTDMTGQAKVDPRRGGHGRSHATLRRHRSAAGRDVPG
jgi:glucosamine--fructose-6-phosphate aminotransferase (isomerizing)